MEVINFLDHGTYLAPDRACLEFNGQEWTYRDVTRMTIRIAAAFARRGFRIGAHVAVLSFNDPFAYMCALGTMRAHMVWIPINPRHSASDIVETLVALDCDLLFYNSELAAVATAVADSIPNLRLICIDSDDADHPSLDRWLKDAPETFEIDPASPDDVTWIQTTGGTSGRPKAVMQTHRAAETFVATDLWKTRTTGVVKQLMAQQMTHAGGFRTFSVLCRAGTIHILPRIKPDIIMDAIEHYRITDVAIPVTILYRMLSDPSIRAHDYSSLRHLNYGTAPISPVKLREAVTLFGRVMSQSYGQTELLPSGTYLSPDDHYFGDEIADDKRLSSCGKETPFGLIAVMDTNGKLLPANQTGEIVARGNGVMKGYYKDPELTAEYSKYGWHHTGDVGYRDDDGFYYIVDRLKDVIVTGGFNVYPAQIEHLINGHPAVHNSAVIGVPDDDWGERVTAVVELKPGMTATQDELIAICRQSLGSLKAPKSIIFRDELPLNPAGKVLKRQIRDEFWIDRQRKV